MNKKTAKYLFIGLLVVMYGALATHLVYEFRLGIVADEYGLDGANIGLFGPWWVWIVLLEVGVIAGLHTVIYLLGRDSASRR